MNIEQPEQLIEYLRQTGRVSLNETPVCRILAGGVSNRTVLVQRSNGEQWVLKQALPKLRVQVDWFSDPERIQREAAGLRWLTQLAPAGSIPALVFEDRQHHLLAMQAVPEPHENWKSMLLGGRVVPDHVGQFARLLATIHRRAGEKRHPLMQEFADRSYFESLRLEPYYGYTATQVTGAAEFLTGLAAQTRQRRLTLVHGDFSPKNILIHQGRLVLLDHEVIHWGDPTFDLGFSLAHLLSKAHHVRPERAAFAEAARRYWQTYAAALGVVAWCDELEGYTVRHTLACLLARVRGRSPLEYLSDAERARQTECVLELLRVLPMSVEDLIGRFVEGLSSDRE